MLRVVHPDDQLVVAEAITAAIENAAPWDVEFRVVHHDGNVRWVMGKGEVLRDEAGIPVRLLGVNVDITDRKRAGEALRASEELFAKAFRGSPDAMVISRQSDGRIIDVNARWETMGGLAAPPKPPSAALQTRGHALREQSHRLQHAIVRDQPARVHPRRDRREPHLLAQPGEPVDNFLG